MMKIFYSLLAVSLYVTVLSSVPGAALANCQNQSLASCLEILSKAHGLTLVSNIVGLPQLVTVSFDAKDFDAALKAILEAGNVSNYTVLHAADGHTVTVTVFDGNSIMSALPGAASSANDAAPGPKGMPTPEEAKSWLERGKAQSADKVVPPESTSGATPALPTPAEVEEALKRAPRTVNLDETFVPPGGLKDGEGITVRQLNSDLEKARIDTSRGTPYFPGLSDEEAKVLHETIKANSKSAPSRVKGQIETPQGVIVLPKK